MLGYAADVAASEACQDRGLCPRLPVPTRGAGLQEAQLVNRGGAVHRLGEPADGVGQQLAAGELADDGGLAAQLGGQQFAGQLQAQRRVTGAGLGAA